MIFITGDTHCPTDIHKLNSKNFPAENLTRYDYVIICGDAGLVWYGRDKEDLYWQKWLENKPWTTLFVDGNHENHAKLDEMPVSEWHSGNVHFLQPNVIHLMRGQIYDIDGKKFFTMGGASSHDIWCRTENKSWWRRELPDEWEYELALNNLEAADWKVDYVITHCCPKHVQNKLFAFTGSDKLMQFFNVVNEKLNFKKWFFGHYHIDREAQIDGKKYQCLYNKVTQLEE